MSVHAEQGGVDFGYAGVHKGRRAGANLKFSRGDILFGLMCLVLLAGALIPLPGLALDFGWILVLSLGLGLGLMCLFLRDTAQADGLGMLLFLWSLGHIWAVAATARSLFVEKSGGAILALCGQLTEPAGMAGVLGIVGGMILAGLVSLAVVGGIVSRRSREFQEEIVPLKRIGLETDLNAGLIDVEDKQRLETQLMGQANFFLNLPRAWRVLVCDMVISLMILTVLGVQAAMSGLMTTMPGPYVMEIHISQCGGASLLFAGISMLLGWTVAGLTGRGGMRRLDNTKAGKETGGNGARKSRKIKIVSRESRKQDVVELLNPESCLPAGPGPLTLKAEGKRDESITVELDEKACEDYFVKGPRERYEGVESVFERFDSADAYFSRIRDLILAYPDKGQTTALCAQRWDALPIRAVFHIALSLSEANQRTLLIDMDPVRSALAKAFDVRPQAFSDGPAVTCLDSISIWSCEGIDGYTAEALGEVAERYRHDFDQVILYAPNLATMASPVHLTRAANTAIVFAKEPEDSRVMYGLFQASPCRVPGVMYSPEQAIEG